LLANGADPNAADARGTTPLQAAVAGGQSAIAAALRRAGAR
jgi:ankyrin repeat protein